jgi:ribonucleoside-diphosphate reductase subunit M2
MHSVNSLTFQQIWAAYKAAEACFWTAEDIDLTQDLVDWKRIVLEYQDESKFVTYILASFLVLIDAVMVELPRRFSSEIQSAEARAFYGFQTAMYVGRCDMSHMNLIYL